ncbi:MAG: 3-hydroxybutyryl-CoA dehydrogenase [Acetobacteraceae bacterium]|nr:3-hydroxybutyryl-CoA dehydrogenase [Acetobacteraceae bacterium]
MSDAQPSPPAIATVGVIGAGQMGGGIAQVCAQSGLSVVLLDARQDAIDKGLSVIGRNLDRQIEKGQAAPGTRDEILGRIRATTDYAAFAEADLVIEAATEREEIKHSIFATLVPHLHPAALLASNTSSISITRLAAGTDRPAKFIGMHFMNPVPVMKLVEIIRGIATDDATYDAVQGLAARLGKTTAVAEDFPGFVVNRVLIPMINEAVFAVHEQVGTVQAIDTGMKLGANHPMGPFELADLIGLDTCLSIMQVLHGGMADSKYRPCPLLVKYVEAGWLGRKTGRGFYDYSVKPPRPTR